MNMGEVKEKFSVTISGSFNKHLDQIQKKILEFQKERFEVLSPAISPAISRKNGFVRLETDRGTPGEIELKHLEAISRSDLLYVINPKGYIGKSVALEIGYAISRDTPVYSLEKPNDTVFLPFVKSEKSVKILKQLLTTQRNAIKFIKKSPSLTDLQNYVYNMVKRRGFEEETVQDVLLLFMEEVGELASAIRHLTGLKVSRKRKDLYKSLRGELADCLIYLLDIANLMNINLEDALREKEKINSARKWHPSKNIKG